MSKAISMANYLDALIDNNPEKMCQVQLVFEPGMGSNAGGLRRAKLPNGNTAKGLYELATVAQRVGPDGKTPLQEFVMVSHVFAAEAVQRVVAEVEVPDEMMPSGLIVPTGAGRITRGPMGGIPNV